MRAGALWALMIATALLALPAAAQLMPDRFDLELSALTAATRPRAGMRLVAVARHELRAGATGQETIGTLLPGAEVAVLATTRTRLSVRLDGWQQDPGGRAVYARRGLRILSLALTPEAARQVKPGQGAADPATGTVWRAVRVTGWLDSGGLVAARDRLSRDLAELNTSACGSCHAAKPPASLTAYQWAGGISSSRHRTLLDADQMALLLHWLQMGASDKGF